MSSAKHLESIVTNSQITWIDLGYETEFQNQRSVIHDDKNGLNANEDNSFVAIHKNNSSDDLTAPNHCSTTRVSTIFFYSSVAAAGAGAAATFSFGASFFGSGAGSSSSDPIKS